jgi:hypothetical protein
MALLIEDSFMSAEVSARVVATARYSRNTAADGTGAWNVSWCTSRLFNRD